MRANQREVQLNPFIILLYFIKYCGGHIGLQCSSAAAVAASVTHMKPCNTLGFGTGAHLEISRKLPVIDASKVLLDVLKTAALRNHRHATVNVPS